MPKSLVIIYRVFGLLLCLWVIVTGVHEWIKTDSQWPLLAAFGYLCIGLDTLVLLTGATRK